MQVIILLSVFDINILVHADILLMLTQLIKDTATNQPDNVLLYHARITFYKPTGH